MANRIEFRIVGSENVSRSFDKVNRSLGKTQLTLAKFRAAAVAASTAVAAVAAVVVGLGAAVAGAFIGLNKFVGQFTVAEDQVGKFAYRLGTTSDVLSEFHAAATFGGQSVANMDLSIQRFNRRIGDALSGMGEASKRFKVLGLDAQKLADMPLQERMYTLADALAAVENPTQRLSYAVGLLDSEGAGFLQTIKNGSKSLKDVADDLEFLGGTVTPQAAANAAVYNDQMGRMRMAVSGVGRAVADQLVPILAGLAKVFADVVASNREEINKWTDELITDTFKVYIVIRNAYRNIRDVINGTFDFKQLLKNALFQVNDFFNAKIRTAQMKMKIVWDFIANGFKLLWRLVLNHAQWVWNNLKAIFSDDPFESYSEYWKGLMLTMHQGWEDLEKDVKDTQIVFREGGETGSELFIKPLANGLDNLHEKALALREQLGIVGIAAVEAGGNIVIPDLPGAPGAGGDGDDKNQKDIEDNSNKLNTMREQYTTFYDAISAMAESFTDRYVTLTAQLGAETFSMLMNTANAAGQAFGAVVTGSQTMSKALSNLFKQVLAQGIAMLVRIGIQRLILGAINKSTVAAEKIANTSAGLAAVYLNSFASAAAIPIYGWAMAPEVAFANLMAAKAGVVAASGTGAVAGVAHGGLDNVPKESTYLLDKGERVLSPTQNKQFTQFIKNVNNSNSLNTLQQNKQFTQFIKNFNNSNSLNTLQQNKQFTQHIKNVNTSNTFNINRVDEGGHTFAPQQNKQFTQFIKNFNISKTLRNKRTALPAFHSGTSYVPREGAYLLSQGERVLSPQQNTELTNQQNESNTMAVTINRIDILPNATNAQALLDMDEYDLERVVADKIMVAFENLAHRGVKMRGV